MQLHVPYFSSKGEGSLWSYDSWIYNIQSVHITTKCVSSNPTHGKVYSLQHYVIVCQWLAAGQWCSLVSSTNKTGHHFVQNMTEILLKVAWNTIALTLSIEIFLPSSLINSPFQSDITQCFYQVLSLILHVGVTSHNVIHHFEMKKIFGGEAKQNPRDST